jgi:hypothetical protein
MIVHGAGVEYKSTSPFIVRVELESDDSFFVT